MEVLTTKHPQQNIVYFNCLDSYNTPFRIRFNSVFDSGNLQEVKQDNTFSVTPHSQITSSTPFTLPLTVAGQNSKPTQEVGFTLEWRESPQGIESLSQWEESTSYTQWYENGPYLISSTNLPRICINPFTNTKMGVGIEFLKKPCFL